MKYTYLLVNLGCILIPFLASFYKKHAFYKTWAAFFKSSFIVACVFIVWDIIFTHIGIWGFNPEYIVSVYIAGLPIEEVLFFFCIPYACTFTYFAYQYLLPNKRKTLVIKVLNNIIGVLSIIIAILNYQKLYTVTTFTLLGLFLLYLNIKKLHLYYYYLTFITIIPFFLISNGILTGSFIKNPVVWYNNAHNLSIRIFTIPIEDFFYGLLLIISNIYLFDYFIGKKNK